MEIYVWIDRLNLQSKPKKHFARDFSDGVLCAEILMKTTCSSSSSSFSRRSNTARMISMHNSTHSSQIKTVGPAISLRTSCWLLPQNEQYSVFFASPLLELAILLLRSLVCLFHTLNADRCRSVSYFLPYGRNNPVTMLICLRLVALKSHKIWSTIKQLKNLLPASSLTGFSLMVRQMFVRDFVQFRLSNPIPSPHQQS